MKNYIGMKANLAPFPGMEVEDAPGIITEQTADEVKIEFYEGGICWGPVEYEKEGVVYIA